MENQGVKSSTAIADVWQGGDVDLLRAGQTALHKLYQEGSARLRFPRNNRGCFEGIMINMSGGMTGGDHMIWDIRPEQETAAMLTTQVAEKSTACLVIFRQKQISVFLSLGNPVFAGCHRKQSFSIARRSSAGYYQDMWLAVCFAVFN